MLSSPSVFGDVLLLFFGCLGPSFLLLLFLVCPVHVDHILVFPLRGKSQAYCRFLAVCFLWFLDLRFRPLLLPVRCSVFVLWASFCVILVWCFPVAASSSSVDFPILLCFSMSASILSAFIFLVIV